MLETDEPDDPALLLNLKDGNGRWFMEDEQMDGDLGSADRTSPLPTIDDDGYDDDDNAFIQKSKRARQQYPWLMIMQETCHSDRQILSGKDLTGAKKKYKRMLCVYCAEYNPTTPWAHLKARKDEKESFYDHEKSTHHQKALAAKNEPQSLPPLQPFASTQPITSSFPVPLLSTVPVISRETQTAFMGVPEMADGMADAPVAVSEFSVLVSSTDIQPTDHQPIATERGQIYDDQTINAAYRPRVKVVPDWLLVQGDLTYSDGQLQSGQDLSKTKKKYRLLMCSYCAAYNIQSAWASMRLRKFETGIMAEHERSAPHRRARKSYKANQGQPSFGIPMS